MQKEPLHVLLADDDADDCRIFRDALEELNLKTIITIVNDGIALMEYLNEPANKLPNIILLDLNMPRMGGLDCLKEIRSNKLLKGLTVAIYSTSASESDIENTFIQGANIYIRKPNDFNTLKKILSEIIRINWQYHTLGLNRDNFMLSM